MRVHTRILVVLGALAYLKPAACALLMEVAPAALGSWSWHSESATHTVSARAHQRTGKDTLPRARVHPANYSVIAELRATLYAGQDPFDAAQPRYADNGYPHTNIDSTLAHVVFTSVTPTYVVELGSMLGGSAILMTRVLASMGSAAEVLCVDPFIGDVNMWDWEANPPDWSQNWRFLALEHGWPTIHKRFLANVQAAGFQHRVWPIAATSTVATRLLLRLRDQGRLRQLPSHIYLDSAHEAEETLLEVRSAWNALAAGGVLFGDDWNWPAIAADVRRFVSLQDVATHIDHDCNARIAAALPGSGMEPGTAGRIVRHKAHWVICKAN